MPVKLENVHTSYYNKLLSSLGIDHFKYNVDLDKLKFEILNLYNLWLAIELLDLKCFHDISDYFVGIKKVYNYKVLLPNL